LTVRIDLIGAGYAGTRLARSFEYVAAGREEDVDVRIYSRADTASLADDPARIRLMFEGSDVIVNAPMTISISMSSIFFNTSFFNTSTDSSSRRSLSLRLRIPFLIVGRRRGGAAIDLR